VNSSRQRAIRNPGPRGLDTEDGLNSTDVSCNPLSNIDQKTDTGSFLNVITATMAGDYPVRDRALSGWGMFTMYLWLLFGFFSAARYPTVFVLCPGEYRSYRHHAAYGF